MFLFYNNSNKQSFGFNEYPKTNQDILGLELHTAIINIATSENTPEMYL